MADDTRDPKPRAVDAALGGMKLQGGGSPDEGEDTIMVNGNHEETSTSYPKRSRSLTPATKRTASQSPSQKGSASQSPKSQDEEEEEEEEEEEKETIGGDITVTVEPGKAPKLSRKLSQKAIPRPPTLYDDMPDSTEEASAVFQVIRDCIYGSKYMGSSEHDALDCDCSEQWGNGKNDACGEDSDCINRATKMECVDGDCNCGSGCQNQRFQQKQYADVSVFKTEKKGYGLRANTDLSADTFIFEYLGEVINEPTFRKRTQKYHDEGIRHFYFMSLTKHEFVDATKKGNLGRFCNHSCNPNCYVDKWVVGEKLRMGIFAERHIKAGEELVFNYNVDRYGADPQPCYCGEPKCTGFIGGKTQTDRATKLPHATIEALGIDDGDDGWDSAVAKKPRKKKTGEDDEEYVSNVQPKGLDEEGVRKVMATLMQCKEKWIAVKLLSRIQRCDDDRVRNRVVQMHGYQILRTTLTTWKDDNNVILQILDILYKFPRLTRNKISDSKIEVTVETLVGSEHEDVAFEAKRLLEDWGKLEVAYRIPRKKFDPTAVPIFERRNTDRSEDVTRSPATPAIVAPTGPRSNLPQRNVNFAPARPPFRRPNALPTGWFQAQDEKGNSYYYSKSGQTTWVRPTFPAPEPPPPPKAPPKSVQTAKAIQDIIDSITKSDPKTPTQIIPTGDSAPKEKKPSEKWRSLSQEKQMKLYENTLFPHIKHVMQKFTKQLPKEDLKKFAKEVGKKLVASDFKNSRVENPTKISEKQEKKVKNYVRDFFEKAVQKKRVLDKKRADKASSNGPGINGPASAPRGGMNGKSAGDDIIDDDADPVVDFSPTALDAPPSSVPATPSISASGSNSDLKRKRDEEDGDETPGTAVGTTEDSFSDSNKRLKEDEASPPPPPPPPPAEDIPADALAGNEAAVDENANVYVNVNGDGIIEPESEEKRELLRQEADLMRENEEAMALAMAVNGGGDDVGKGDGVDSNGSTRLGIGSGHGNNVDADTMMEGVDEGLRQKDIPIPTR